MIADLAIVGAGPAGIAAAIEATSLGLSVTVLDENAAPGGRIWQALETRGPADEGDTAALAMLRTFRRCGADTRYRAAVWAIEPDGTVFFSQNGVAHAVQALHILLATGTTERPVPIPGWTLPGVMTVGAAQIASKTAGLVPDKGTWIAGQGPLLLLYTVQALRAGGRPAGVLDLSDPAQRWPALGKIAGFGDIAKGVSWRWEIARAGIPWIRTMNPRAEGNGKLERIVFGTRTEPADLLLVHDGVIPSVHITRALGCAHRWNDGQQCWEPETDAWGQTSHPNVYIAGDGAGINGAIAATISGRTAARAIAGRRETPPRKPAIRPFLDTLYRHRPLSLTDETLVCRCEEVTAGAIRQAAATGCLGLNQLKAYTRCGMGPCQGRMCASTAAEVLADARNVPVHEIEPLRTRFPTKPLTVGELAALD